MKRRVAAVVALALCLTAHPGFAVTTNLISKGSNWKYLDNGTNQATAWRAAAFDDGSWASGAAQLGYGDGDEATVVSFGPNSSNKYITTYFRHHFQATDVASIVRLDALLMRDDGAVVYLNGTEVMRSNLPAGSIGYLQLASGAVAGASESAYFSGAIDPALLLEGDNVLAVEVHQSSGSSTDVSFDLALRAADTPVVISRGPYLQRGSDESVVVRWRTDLATDSRVRYGTSPANLDQVVTLPANTTEHEVTLSGLSSATTYYYSVGSSTDVLAGGDADHSFVTAPQTGTAKGTRVWVLGDSGTANADARAVRDSYDAFTGSQATDLWLMLGDNAYESGTDAEYQAAVFDTYPAHLRREVLWPTLGNHDAASAASATQSGPYYDIFTLPTLGEAGGIPSATEAYYSFDYGNIHFICLDSQDSDRSTSGAMLSWLEDDLAATSADWIIAFWHHPPYSKGSHDSDSEGRLVEMRQNALPILEAYGVDLVLAGHSHSYERSILLDSHYGVSTTLAGAMVIDGGDGRADGDGVYAKDSSTPHEGAVYVVAGSSGQISSAPLNHPAMYVSLLALGSLVLDIDSSTLNAHFVDGAGAVVDYFTIVKSTPLPTSTPTQTPTASPSPTHTPTMVGAPTSTPTPSSHHDTVLLPLKPIAVAIAAGTQEVLRSIKLKVRNVDVVPQREEPGHPVRLIASSDDCPGSTIDGSPDFDIRAAGDQDQLTIAGGASKRAILRLRIRADEFVTHNSHAPQRCTITISAVTELPGDQDPTPANNVATLELNVVDANDSPSAAIHESTVDSLKPLKVTIRSGHGTGSKRTRVLLGNADPGDGHAVDVAISGGTCPAGSVSLASSVTQVAALSKGAVDLTVTPNAADIDSASRKSPHRCTVELTATSAIPGNDEPDPTNDVTRLVVDVDDRNDY